MSRRPLVIITTRLPPEVCGIGTYSWLLHKHWPDSSREILFLVVAGAAASRQDLGLETIAQFGSSADTLARELKKIGPADILLHYAGRAYHRYGCPRWLPPVLAAWKRTFPSGRLAIFFHELPGQFPITSRHYWIDFCNRRVIRRLAGTADVVMTNTAEHAQKLEAISGDAAPEWLPVPSNIPVETQSASSRHRGEFVVFGLSFGRWQTLQMFDAHIRSWISRGRLTKLHVIGPPDEKMDARARELISQWPDPSVVQHHGMLAPRDVSEVLTRAQFGLANASAENWSKSAVFMAFAAHGVPIVTQAKSEIGPLRFTMAPDEVQTINDHELEERSLALREWYETQADWNVVARRISSLLPVPDEALS